MSDSYTHRRRNPANCIAFGNSLKRPTSNVRYTIMWTPVSWLAHRVGTIAQQYILRHFQQTLRPRKTTDNKPDPVTVQCTLQPESIFTILLADSKSILSHQ